MGRAVSIPAQDSEGNFYVCVGGKYLDPFGVGVLVVHEVRNPHASRSVTEGGEETMKWKKVDPELNQYLDEKMAPFNAVRRPMFGSSCYFVNGNMFAGTHQDTIILRLSEADRREIQSLNSEVTPFQPMEGRMMKEYVALPESVYGMPETLELWIKRAYQYALSLKPKVKTIKNGQDTA
jgi:TfoX/Sxy family transcriptional regulator of competence genes